jgi:hypothetical protein
VLLDVDDKEPVWATIAEDEMFVGDLEQEISVVVSFLY